LISCYLLFYSKLVQSLVWVFSKSSY
jgi:hypothetical protein